MFGVDAAIISPERLRVLGRWRAICVMPLRSLATEGPSSPESRRGLGESRNGLEVGAVRYGAFGIHSLSHFKDVPELHRPSQSWTAVSEGLIFKRRS